MWCAGIFLPAEIADEIIEEILTTVRYTYSDMDVELENFKEYQG